MTSNTNQPVLNRATIALVDDDEDLRLLLRHSLELRGYRIIEFESGEEALGWEKDNSGAETPHPVAQANLILLDVNLPGLSGIETLGLLKESPALRHIPVAMLTAHKEADVVLTCVRAGASDYFVKPLTSPEVLRRIDRLLADPGGTLAKTAEVELTWNFQEIIIREIKRSERSDLPVGIVIGAVRRVSSGSEELTPDEIDRLWTTAPVEAEELTRVVEDYVTLSRPRLREYDVLVPFGTGEFSGVLPGTDFQGVQAVVRKLYQTFQNDAELPPLSRQERWTLLVGGACYPDDGEDSLALFTFAESNLSDLVPEKPAAIDGDSLVYPKTVRCFSCARHFAFPKIAARRLSPVSRESDMRLVFEDLDPLYFGAIACPNCGIASLESDWKGIRSPEPPVFGWSYSAHTPDQELTHPTQTIIPDDLQVHLSPPFEAWVDSDREIRKPSEFVGDFSGRDRLVREAAQADLEPPDLQTALARHLLARSTYDRAGASPLRRARVAHRVAWLCRIGGDSKNENRYLREALDFYLTAFHFEDLTGVKPNELEILFLTGELSFRIGEEARAVSVFEHLVRDSRLETNELFKKMVHRRWYEARNEEPPAE